MTNDPISENGNSNFNLNDAVSTGLTLDDLAKVTEGSGEKVDFQAIDEKRFAKPVVHERAMAAITPEDLAFEAELQRMSQENPIIDESDEIPLKLTQEEPERELLREHLPDTKPAQTLNELEHQVFLAKGIGCNAIEADEKVIRYFTRNSYPADTGYFMYKDIKVFIPGRFENYERTDSLHIHDKIFRNSKVK